MKILGIDGGFHRMGISVLEFPNLIYSEVIHHIRQDEPFNKFLNSGIQDFSNKFTKLVETHCPDLVVAETIPVGRLGSNSELNVAAITVCKVICFQKQIPWEDIAANTVKKQIANDGKATKAKIKKCCY